MEGMQEIGEVLRKERERQGRTLEEVHRATHITTRYLMALEEGAFEVIPGEVYLKGFLRRYAQFLGIDGEELVSRYRERREPKPEPTEVRPATGTEDARPSAVRRSLGVAVMVVALAGVVLGVALAWSAWTSRQARRVIPKELAWPGENPARTATAAPEQGGQTPSGEQSDNGEPHGGQGGAETASPQGAAQPPTAETAAQSGDRQPAAESPAAPVRVGVTVFARCWFRVVSDGRLVYEGELAPGEEMAWTARERLSVRFGNPAGVRVLWNGRPVPLDSQDPVTWLFLPKTIVGPSEVPSPAGPTPEPGTPAGRQAPAGQGAAAEGGANSPPGNP
ncbi:MAG TPA: helix-turn-helix domain-containing protein [Firmicutes bacterium]|nr:helix-turn-helix domain-containing protein [Bacillota bacterium]